MKKIKVLMIDDNIALTEMVKEYFKDSSEIEIMECCYNGEEGLKKIDELEGKYDVILLDLIMPKKDGISVLEDLKERNIQIGRASCRERV